MINYDLCMPMNLKTDSILVWCELELEYGHTRADLYTFLPNAEFSDVILVT